MANRTPLAYLEQAYWARLRFKIQEEKSQRKKQEIIEREAAESRFYLAACRLASYFAARQCKDIARMTFVAEAWLELREEATERATRQAVQELAQPLRNNRRSRPYCCMRARIEGA